MNPLDASTHELVVDDIQSLTCEIKSFRLVRPNRAALAPFSAGAHIRVRVGPDHLPQWRHYSLVNFDVNPASTSSPDSYLLAVKRETDGKGGSRWMHEHVQPGDTVVVSEPINAFPLNVGDEPILLAGGIGITPITAMAAALVGSGSSFELHYSGRSTSHMPFVEDLATLAHQRLHTYSDDQPDRRLDLPTLLEHTKVGRPIYICGPKGMVDSALSLALERGWERNQIHVELFSEGLPNVGDSAFDVELRKSGLSLRVGPNQTILDAMQEAGLDPLYDCRRGECGICQTTVIEGKVEHRDYCLSEEEKRSGRIMQICVSRACQGRLVLDA